MNFIRLENNKASIAEMSALASSIVKEHYDSIIGPEQNDYMIKKFQSPESIEKQMRDGYRYYFVSIEGDNVGFISIMPKEDEMYLSKFYLRSDVRGKGYSREMLAFIIEEAKKEDLNRIMLNVNKNNGSTRIYEKLGFLREGPMITDIGQGYIMDDYVYRYYI